MFKPALNDPSHRQFTTRAGQGNRSFGADTWKCLLFEIESDLNQLFNNNNKRGRIQRHLHNALNTLKYT